MTVYRFTVPGHPISKSNFHPRGGGHSPESVARQRQLFEYEDVVGSYVGEQMKENGWSVLEGAVQVLIVSFKKADRGDCSNLGKSVFDALQGILYDDDKQVRLAAIFDGGVDKENPRLEILASSLEKMEILRAGDLAYVIPKSVDSSLKAKKNSPTIIQAICPDCGLPQERKSVVLAGTRRVLKVCKNDHGILV